MKTKAMLVALCLALASATSAYAEDGKKEFSEKQLAQQQRMRDCNAEAKDKALKGADRKAYMKTCLSAGKVTAELGSAAASAPAAASDARAAQKDKMKSCNADAKAKGLKGEDRKTFMSDCLKAA